MFIESGTTPNHRLFCYGSLQIAEVIRAVTGRVPVARAAVLRDHALRRIRNASYPGVKPMAGAETPGIVYDDITETELSALDAFEGEPYARGLRTIRLLNDGEEKAWVYLLPHARLDGLTDEPWDLESFRRNDLADFMRRCFGQDGG